MIYKTEKGSTVTLYPNYLVGCQMTQRATVSLDFVEEDNACIDCDPEPFPETRDGKKYLVWKCDFCGGGEAELKLVEKAS